jgi:peptidoglycan hydrolase-like protein with peptidoglycan-binding domain
MRRYPDLFPVASAATPSPSPAAPTPSPRPTGSTIFTRDLTVGSQGDDVKALQQYLNNNGFPVAPSGPGSTGNETILFGGLTRTALAAWQAAKGISPAAGYFGPKTRAVIAGNSAASSTPSPSPATSIPTPPSQPTGTIFTRDLTIGSTGDDVKALQVYLNMHGFPVASSGPGSTGNETMMFGYATEAALKAFQQSKGIVPATGYFGPVTRGILNGQ